MNNSAIYLYGLVSMIAFIIYLIIFNYVWYKVTGEDNGSENVFGYLFIPIVIPIGIGVLILLPFIIGKEVLGLS